MLILGEDDYPHGDIGRLLLLGDDVVLDLAEEGGLGGGAPVLDVAVMGEPCLVPGLIHRNGDVECPG